jgi:sulfur carrier protein
MELVINGEKQQVSAQDLEALLEELKVAGVRCATMINGRIVKRADRPTTALHEGDTVEVITMVGGG